MREIKNSLLSFLILPTTIRLSGCRNDGHPCETPVVFDGHAKLKYQVNRNCDPLPSQRVQTSGENLMITH